MPSTQATFSAFLKTRYTMEKVENLTLSNKPFMALIEKNTDFSGEQTVIPLIYGNPQGIAGASRVLAQTNATNIVGAKFNLTAGEYFGSVEIGDRVLMMSRNNQGALLQNKVTECDGLYEAMSNDEAVYLAGNGGGAIGQRLSVAGNVITLSDQNDTCNFEVGMKLKASANDGSDAAHALRAGTPVTVVSVERDAGTVTVDNVANITAFANGDFLFREGDFAGNTGVSIIKGVGAYIFPTAAPPALYGMTRTADPQRLAGCRVPTAAISGLGIEDRIQYLGAYMTGTYRTPPPDTLILNPLDWQRLSSALQTYGIRDMKDEDTRFGFRVIEWTVGGQSVKIYADSFFPRGTAFLLRKRHWKLHSMGPLIHPIEADGISLLRKATTDDYEYRLKSYPALECNAPGYNGRVALT